MTLSDPRFTQPPRSAGAGPRHRARHGFLWATALGILAALPAQARPLNIPASLNLRPQITVKDKAGRASLKSTREVLTSMDADQVVSLSNGKKMTIQQYLDKVGRLAQQRQLIPSGGALSARSEATLRLQRSTPAVIPSGPALRAIASAPGQTPLSARWSHELGDRDTFAAYLSFQAVDQVSSSSVACSMDLSAGAYVFGNDLSILKASSSARVSGGAQEGTISVTVAGQAPETRSGSVSQRSPAVFAKTFLNENIAASFPVFPGVNLKLSASLKGSARVEIYNELQSTAINNGRAESCTVVVTPSFEAQGQASASASLGIPDIFDIIEVGVRGGPITLASAAVPTSLNVSLLTGARANVALVSRLQASFLKGKLVAFLDIPCVDGPFGAICSEDLTFGVIQHHNEFTLTSFDGFSYSDTLIDKGLTIAAKDLDLPTGGPKNPGACKIAGQIPCLCDGEVSCVPAGACNKLCRNGGRP